ncbi:hypothetical protein ABPG75_013370 [Micractinium tetrahymenae]
MPLEQTSRALQRRAGGSQALGPAAALRLPIRYPKLTVTLVLWLLGLFLAFMAKPPPVSQEALAAFKAKVKQAEGVVGELTLAERQLMEAELAQARHKVWFWRFKPEARQAVAARQPAVDAARQQAAAVRERRDALLREAKALLGLWSEAGVEEGKELFWESFASGKVFAQRQSFWDALFVILGSRERDWLAMLLNLLIRTLINFFTGMVVACFVFLIQLPSLIWSYQPALWSGVAFFAAAAVASISVIASYLGLLFGAGAGATYATLSMVAAAQQQRLEGGAAQRRRIDYGRQHYE